MRRAFACGLLAGLALAACQGTNLHLEQGRLYSCDRDAGQRADAGQDPQCPGGYHCGLEGYCYPVSLAGGFPFPCEYDGDCNTNWRCGASDPVGARTCQDSRVARDYPCNGSDTWCEQGWRCGPENRCVDPATDPLVIAAPTTASATLLSPVAIDATHLEGAPALGAFAAAGSPALEYALVALETNTSVRALIASGHVAADPVGLHFTPALLDSQVPVGSAFTVAGGALWWPVANGVARQVVQPGAWSQPTTLGPVEARAIPLTFSATALRQDPSRIAAHLLACGANDVAVWDEASPVAAWASPTPVRDCAWSRVSSNATPYVLTANGIYEPSASQPGVPFAHQRVDAGFPAGALLAVADLSTGPAFSILTGAADGGLLSYLPGPGDGGLPTQCPVACQGPRAVSIRTGEGGMSWVVVECQASPSGVPGPWFEARTPGVCDVAWEGSERVVQRSTSAGEVVLTPQGHLDWLSLHALSPDDAYRPLALVAPPLFVRGAQAELALTQETSTSPTTQPWQRPAPGAPWLASAPARGLGAPLAAVRGQVDWWVIERRGAGADARGLEVVEGATGQTLHASLARAGELASGPVTALAQTTNGGVRLVASAFDSVIEGVVTDAGPGTLQVRLTPLPRQAITSLALDESRPTDGGVGPGLSGALVAQGRVFRFRAVNDVVWRAEELSLGNLPAVRDTWSDEQGLRAGLVNGQVVALGARVPVSQPLPDGAQARQFVTVAGHVFALADQGLFVLRAAVADGGLRLAWWERDARLDAVMPEGAAWTQGQARLQVEGRVLYAFSEQGSVGRLDFAP